MTRRLNESGIYSDPGIYFLIAHLGCQEWQVPVLVFTSSIVHVVRGHHIYKTIWTPVIDETKDETLQVVQEGTSEHDKYAVTITKAKEDALTCQEKYQEYVFYAQSSFIK